ncbi:MAG: hypothetical protein EB036_14890, partial [Betaproteobacteria bacterium]|nr:hypothetical protein [Betaproteobacteria bacterium]
MLFFRISSDPPAIIQPRQRRKQFGKRIAEFQGIQWKFAEMKI